MEDSLYYNGYAYTVPTRKQNLKLECRQIPQVKYYSSLY